MVQSYSTGVSDCFGYYITILLYMHWHGSRIGKRPSNFNFCLKRMAKIRSACRYYNGGKVTAITAVDFSRAMLEALPLLGWFEIGVPPVIHSCLGFSINQAFLDTPIYGNPHISYKKCPNAHPPPMPMVNLLCTMVLYPCIQVDISN